MRNIRNGKNLRYNAMSLKLLVSNYELNYGNPT